MFSVSLKASSGLLAESPLREDLPSSSHDPQSPPPPPPRGGTFVNQTSRPGFEPRPHVQKAKAECNHFTPPLSGPPHFQRVYIQTNTQTTLIHLSYMILSYGFTGFFFFYRAVETRAERVEIDCLLLRNRNTFNAQWRFAFGAVVPSAWECYFVRRAWRSNFTPKFHLISFIWYSSGPGEWSMFTLFCFHIHTWK